MSRPYPKVKDKIKIEFNPITGEFDLISEFNPNRIVTHELTPFGSPISHFDTGLGIHVATGHQVVTDDDGQVVVI